MGPRHRLHHRATQRGNALVYALLGLIVAAGASGAAMQARLTQARVAAGQAEATVLDALRTAANAAILDQLTTLQSGGALSRNGTTVAPQATDGETVWSPTPLQLAALGYLPPQWTTTRSTLNQADYQIDFRRTPTGCSGPTCGIEGTVVLLGPIRDNASQPDLVTIGPILSRIGVDAGMSLQANPTTITGYARAWSAPNPVTANPPGVVAARIGTSGAAMSQYVRIRDTRDPDLQGDLSVAGALRSAGALAIGPTTSPCIRLEPTGQLTLGCTGQFDAQTLRATRAQFTDPSGATTTIGGSTLNAGGSITANADITATGSLRAAQLQPTSRFAPGSPCTDSGAIAGDTSANGLVLCADGTWRGFATQLTEGLACGQEGQLASSNGVGLICSGGTYRSLARFTTSGTLGSTCTATGAIATDTSLAIGLVCRTNPRSGGTRWQALNDLVSNIVFIGQTLVADGDTVPKPDCQATAGSSGGTPAVFLQAQTEGSTNATFDRYLVDGGSTWTAYLRDSTNTPLGGATALAQVYCYY